MKFSIPFFKSKKESAYLGIHLSDKEGLLFYITPFNGSMRITEEERFNYSNGWDNLTDDIDEVLFRLEEKRKAKSPDTVIFFLNSQYIDHHLGEIKKTYTLKIKEIVKKLDFTALGYIECREAVAEYLKEKEQGLLNGIVIEFDHSSFTVFTYINGKLIFSDSLSRTDDFIADMNPCIDRIKRLSILPSKMYMYNERYIDSRASKIFEHQWQGIDFPQQPKVEVINDKELHGSFLKVFAKQVLKTTERESIPFVPIEEPTREVLGFVLGSDVPERDISQTESHFKSKNKLIASNFLPSIGMFVSSLLSKLQKLAAIKRTPSMYAILSIVGVILIGIGVFVTENSFHKAEVTIFFPSKTITKTTLVQPLLNVATQSATFKESIKTTGVRNIGEKSKGTVVIYNSSLNESKSFAKGTKLSSSNGLGFILESDVKVASASGDASSITSSTAKAPIIAGEIGPDYNLSAGSKFSVAETSSATIIAKNEGALTGGTKRQVRVVAKEDIDQLRKVIVSKSKKTSLKDSIPQLTSLETVKESVSAEVGDEAESVALTAETQLTQYSFIKKSMIALLTAKLKDDTPKGMILPSDQIHYSVKEVDSEKEPYELTVDVKAKAVKEFKKEELLAKVKGVKTDTLTKILKEEYGASGVEYVIKHPISFFENILPYFIKNISLKVNYN